MDFGTSERLHGAGAQSPGPVPVVPQQAPTASNGFTVLRSTTGRMATKQFRVGRSGQIRKTGYDRELFFSLTPHAAEGLEELAVLLCRLERDSRAFIVRGAPLPTTDRRRARRLLHDDPKTGEPATLEAVDRAWIMLDLDGVACPSGLDPRVPEDADDLIEHLVGLLPPEFHDAGCFWQWSGSQGVPDRLGQEPPDELRAHLFFWLDRTVPDHELRRWAITLKQKGLPIDPTVFAPVQPHYVAAPIFDGLPDPIRRRSGFRRGLADQVALVLPPLEPRHSAINGQSHPYDGAGLRFHLSRLGPEGYQEPIKSAIAACFAEHSERTDDERLKQAIRSRIDEVENDHPRSAADLARYRSERFLDDKIDWTRAREEQRQSAIADAGRSLPPYFGDEATDRDTVLAAQSTTISGWLDRNLRIARARHEIDRRRDEAHAGVGIADDVADPEADALRRLAAISRRVRRDVLQEFDLQRLPKDGERLLVTGAQGTGKSRTVAETIAAMTGAVTVRWLVPTLGKAEEQAGEYLRLARPESLDVVVVRGRGAPDPKQPGQAMCPRHAVVNRAAAMRVDVQETICRSCELRSRCGYQRQRNALKGGGCGLFLASSDYLWIPCPAPSPDLLVVDESVIGKATETISLDPYRVTEDDKWASRDLDLALRNRQTATCVRSAIVERSGRELAYLREQGVTDDDLGAALKHLASREELRPEVDGRMPDVAIARALDAVEVRETMKVLVLLRQVRREFERPRIRLNSITFDPAARIVVNGVVEASPRIFTGYVRTPRLKRAMPVLALDGTGSLLLNRKVFGEQMTGQRFPVPRDAEVVQVRAKSFSRRSLAGSRTTSPATQSKHVDEARRLRKRVIDLLETIPGDILLVTYKAVEELLRPELPARIHIGHFGAVRGLNSFKHCETVVILGREQPGPQAIERMTRAFAATDAEPLIPFGGYALQCRAYRLRGREAHVEVVPVHPDPRCQEMLEQVREAEIVQAVDRVRPVFNRRRVILLTNLPLDITVDRVVPWQDLQPSRFAVAFARHGVLPLSPRDLTEVFPDLWGSAEAAKKDLLRHPETGDKAQIRTSIWGLSPINCSYRRIDQRGPVARALVRADLSQPRRALEALVGPLSMFHADGRQPPAPGLTSEAEAAGRSTPMSKHRVERP